MPLKENTFVVGFRTIAKTIPTPTNNFMYFSTLVYERNESNHMDAPQTIHDFGGFPKRAF